MRGRPVGRRNNLALLAGLSSPPIGNPPIAPTKNRKQSWVKTVSSGGLPGKTKGREQ